MSIIFKIKIGYNFVLDFTSRKISFIEDIGKNVKQFSAPEIFTYIYTQIHYDTVSLRYGIHQPRKAEYPFVFVPKPENPTRSTKDITGEKMAFGDKHITQEYLIPRTMLYEFGIPFDALTKPGNTSSYHNYAKAVISGEHDLCKIQNEREECLEQRSLTRIVHYSHHDPSNNISTERSIPASRCSSEKCIVGLNFTRPRQVIDKNRSLSGSR